MFDVLLILSALAMILAIAGNLFINKRKRIGYVVWIVSNSCWVIVNLIGIETNWFQTIMFVTFTGLNVHGFISWKRSKLPIKNEAI